jgi:hypothetical protein
MIPNVHNNTASSPQPSPPEEEREWTRLASPLAPTLDQPKRLQEAPNNRPDGQNRISDFKFEISEKEGSEPRISRMQMRRERFRAARGRGRG